MPASCSPCARWWICTWRGKNCFSWHRLSPGAKVADHGRAAQASGRPEKTESEGLHRPSRTLTTSKTQAYSEFPKLYARAGRPSIAPEKLLRALLLQLLYSVRSERLLMEQLDYNLLFRWFVGLSMDDAVWDASTFSKNRERMLEGDIAEAFFQGVLGEARAGQLLSDEHFTVDGTLLEAWASHKSFRPVDPVGKDNDQEPKPPAVGRE